MAEFMYTVWAISGVVFIFVLLFIIPILIEIKKTIQAYRVISERIELVSDIRSWVKILKIFRKERAKK